MEDDAAKSHIPISKSPPIIPVPLGYTFDPSSTRFLENEWSCLVSPLFSDCISHTSFALGYFQLVEHLCTTASCA